MALPWDEKYLKRYLEEKEHGIKSSFMSLEDSG